MPASLRLQGKRRSACLPLSAALGGQTKGEMIRKEQDNVIT